MCKGCPKIVLPASNDVQNDALRPLVADSPSLAGNMGALGPCQHQVFQLPSSVLLFPPELFLEDTQRSVPFLMTCTAQTSSGPTPSFLWTELFYSVLQSS